MVKGYGPTGLYCNSIKPLRGLMLRLVGIYIQAFYPLHYGRKAPIMVDCFSKV